MGDDDLSMLRKLSSNNPLKGYFIVDEAIRSEKLANVMRKNLTLPFYATLRNKIKNLEQVIIEIKGEVRSSKSTVAMSLADYICKNWNFYHSHRPRTFEAKHIYHDQGTWLYDVKKAEEGQVFIVDEQRSQLYGSGTVREGEQLTDVLNICAKRCNSLFFIQPRKFMERNGIFGLEILTKDKDVGITLCFLHDLTKSYKGYPEGYIVVPKLNDEEYRGRDKSEWSDYRKANYTTRGPQFDFWSPLEEDYEKSKDKNIDKVVKLDERTTYKQLNKVAKRISKETGFWECKNKDEKKFYITHMISKGKLMGLTADEIELVIGGASLYHDGLVK